MAQFGPYLILLSILTALAYWWRIPRKRKAFVVLGSTLVLALVVESYGLVALRLNLNNNAGYNMALLGEFLLIHALVMTLVPNRTILFLSAAVGTGASLLSFWHRSTPHVLWIEGILVCAILVAGLSLWVLWRTADTANSDLLYEPLLWLFGGTLIYHVGMLPMVGLLEVLSMDHPLLHNLYVTVQLLAVAQYLCLARACSLEARQVRSEHVQ